MHPYILSAPFVVAVVSLVWSAASYWGASGLKWIIDNPHDPIAVELLEKHPMTLDKMRDDIGHSKSMGRKTLGLGLLCLASGLAVVFLVPPS